MPDLANSTTRDKFSELVKGYNKFEDYTGVNFCFATVGVEGSGDIDNIGVPVMWSESDSAFIEFAPNADWEASTAYSLGDVVKPTTQNGFEYVCITAGNSDASEPTWPVIPGSTETETGGAVWICRLAYTGNSAESTLPNGAHIGVIVGPGEGRGFNYEDTTLSATATNMTVIYRGPATLAKNGFEWGSIVAADQAEFYKALEASGISLVESGTTVDPTFVN